jgi:diguanylate cyclase (GGDEF)-like protein
LLAPDVPEITGDVLGIDERSCAQKTLAAGIALTFLLVTILAARFGGGQGPELRGFVPIVATLWTCAEMVTAILLGSQFLLTGRVVIAWLSFAYGFTALLTMPYLAYFPGVFVSGPYARGDEQISVVLWALWHLSFPLIIAAAFLRDPQIARRVAYRHRIRGWFAVGVVSCVAVAAVATIVIVACRAHLPAFVANGRFLFPFTAFVAPAVALTNAVACVIVLTRKHVASPLRIWLAVSLFTAMLDGVLNGITPARYSVAWYFGKVETLATSGIVLTILLFEVSRINHQMVERAMLDPLTGLRNRRELEQRLRQAFDAFVLRPSAIAMLVVDIDLFKKYNDTYGHAAGDRTLKLIARALEEGGLRPGSDILARYGGEEFVIVLTDTSAAAAVAMATGIRERLAALAIPHVASPTGCVTASVGIGYAADGSRIEPERLFELADRALYAAKDRGRDRAVLFSDGSEAMRAPHAGRLLAAINDERPREHRLRTGT